MISPIRAYVTSWNRPKLLEHTISTLSQFVQDITVIDNGSNLETVETVKRIAPSCLLLPENVGINQAYERAIPHSADGYVLVSDGDLYYAVDPNEWLSKLEDPDILAVSFVDSPEHDGEKRQHYKLKQTERGGSLLMKAAVFETFRPLPQLLTDFDWWVFRDSPCSIQALNKYAAVVPRACYHLGYQCSTWCQEPLQEFEYVKDFVDTILRNGKA